MSPNRVVRTSTGDVAGTVGDGMVSFLGVPYADAPFGANRLRPPRPVRPWTGERDATRYGPTAPKGPYPDWLQPLLPEVDLPGDDCLNLNVWAPDRGAGHPVLVWIHGGSFTQGSGSLPEYDGSRFARSGVVCVTINYRLGAEGFLALPDGTANLGLRDMIAALTWVRDEIAGFGGDPARVTVAGESAGAMAVAALLAVPSAEGLFARAIMQSGSGAPLLHPETAALVVARVGAALGAPATRQDLAVLPRQRLVDATAAVAAEVFTGDPALWGEVAFWRLPFAPVVDGDLLPRPVNEALAAGASSSVPLLVSTTRDEFRLFAVASGMIGAVGEAAFTGAAAALGLTAEGIEAYRAAHPGAGPGDLLAAVQADFYFRRTALQLLAARPAGAAPAWLARFDTIAPDANGGLGSCHASDVPYVFGTAVPRPLLGDQPSAAAVDTAHTAWVRFVTGDDPGWPAADASGTPTGLLGDKIEVADPDAALRAVWPA